MGRYGIERGDVLLSLQMILTREAERPRPRLVAPVIRPEHRVASPRPAPRPARPQPSAAAEGRVAREKQRDQMLERSWPALRPAASA